MNLSRFLVLFATAASMTASPRLLASDADDRIETSFANSYTFRVYLRDDAVRATSKEGTVTLTGQVNEAAHKHLAQEAVASLPGVKRVENRLEIRLEGNDKSDSWIRAKVRSVLALHQAIDTATTQVDIRDGVITLRGVATSEAQRELASEYAEDVHGVLLVTNLMTIASAPATAKPIRPASPEVDDASISAQVRVTLLLHRSTSTANATISTLNGIVSITGIARNLAEKVLITKLASDIPGVKQVENRMSIAPALSQANTRPFPPRGLTIGPVLN